MAICRKAAAAIAVAALVKQEDRHAEEAQFAGQPAQPVDILLHRVADKDQRVDLLRLVSRIAWVSTRSIWVSPPTQDTERITRCRSAALVIHRLALHSLKPR